MLDVAFDLAAVLGLFGERRKKRFVQYDGPIKPARSGSDASSASEVSTGKAIGLAKRAEALERRGVVPAERASPPASDSFESVQVSPASPSVIHWG